MSNELTYKPGDWWIICDVCGFKIKASKSRHRWDGLIVCKEDWEARHPMDFIKTPTDKIAVPYSRPRTPDTFVTTAGNNRTINGNSINSTEVN